MIFDALVMSYENLLRLQDHIILPPSLPVTVAPTPTAVRLPAPPSSSLIPLPSYCLSAPRLIPSTLPPLSSSSPSLSSAKDVRTAVSAYTPHLLPLATSSFSISSSSSTSLSLSSTHHIPNSNIHDENVHYENHPKALESKTTPIDVDIPSVRPAPEMSERGEMVAADDRLLVETFRYIF
jgi:hypothetical protein